MTHDSGLRFRLAIAALSVGLLAVAACGDDDSSPSSGSTDSPSNESILGAEQAATGTPVKIGLVSDGRSASLDLTPEIDAARATVEYVNSYQNGLNGHPIDLVVCETGQTPSGATDCASEMIEADVSAVLVAVAGQGASLFTALAPSGIPLVCFTCIEDDIVAQPGAYVLTDSLAIVSGAALVGQQNGITKAALVVIDVPAASGLSGIGPVFYGNAGIDLSIVAVPPDVADPSAQIQAALDAGAEQIGLLGTPAFCTGVIRAAKALGFTGSIVLPPQCIDPGAEGSIPGGYEGMTLLTFATDDSQDADVQTFNAVMETYAEGASTAGVASGGFVVVEAFARAMSGLDGEITPQSVTDRLNTMPEAVPLPLGGGITFQCGTAQVEFAPNLCGTEILQATLQANGTGENFEVINTGAVETLG